MDADSTPEPLEDVLLASPAPGDEEHPPGSSDEEDDSIEEGGESNSGANVVATLDVDDDLDEGEEPLPLEASAPRTSDGVRRGKLSTYSTHRGTRKSIDSAAVGIGWPKGTSRGRLKRAPATSTTTEVLSTATAAHIA